MQQIRELEQQSHSALNEVRRSYTLKLGRKISMISEYMVEFAHIPSEDYVRMLITIKVETFFQLDIRLSYFSSALR